MKQFCLLSKVGSLERNHANIDGVGDKGLVVHQFVGGKGGHSVQEQLGCLLKVPDGHTVQTLIDLQPVPPVPVTTFLNQTANTNIQSK